jgi:hypothetical protein
LRATICASRPVPAQTPNNRFMYAARRVAALRRRLPMRGESDSAPWTRLNRPQEAHNPWPQVRVGGCFLRTSKTQPPYRPKGGCVPMSVLATEGGCVCGCLGHTRPRRLNNHRQRNA